eukprot:g15060.t1
MGDDPRAIERRGRAVAQRFLGPHFETKWISETSADLSIRPRPAVGGTPARGRYMRLQLKYNETSFPSWLRSLKCSLNKGREKYHDMTILAMSACQRGKACVLEIHKASLLTTEQLDPSSWKSYKDAAQELQLLYDGGRGHCERVLEWSTISSPQRLVEQMMREAFFDLLAGCSSLSVAPQEGEYGVVDYRLKVRRGKRVRILRVQEKVLKVRKKNGKPFCLRADMVRHPHTNTIDGCTMFK